MKKSFLSASLLLLVSGLSLQVQATNLLEAYKDAVKNDPQTLKAKAQYDVAKASESIAFSSLLPSLNFTAGYSSTDYETYSDPTTYDDDVSSLSYGISLSQSIFEMGTWYSLDASEKRALQAQAGFDLSQQALITRVTLAYFNVLKAQDNL
jgi:outer membrane protein